MRRNCPPKPEVMDVADPVIEDESAAVRAMNQESGFALAPAWHGEQGDVRIVANDRSGCNGNRLLHACTRVRSRNDLDLRIAILPDLGVDPVSAPLREMEPGIRRVRRLLPKFGVLARFFEWLFGSAAITRRLSLPRGLR